MFHFSDTLHPLLIKTMCGEHSGIGDDLFLTFEQGGKSCMTKGIDASRTSDCENAMDVTGKDQLGDCADFNFSSSSASGIVRSNGSNDGWRGEWIRVVLSDHAYLECPIGNWIDGDNDANPSDPSITSSLMFNCTYVTGEYLNHYFYCQVKIL